MKLGLVIGLIAFFTISRAYVYDPAWTQYNLNENKDAVNPLDFWGEWTDHNYTASPSNWRFPFYTLFLDRFVNGDPTNDNINGTAFERDVTSNQMRHGGDLQGLIDTLDYLEGMGVKGIYIAGSPFMNQPWGYDQYSPIDLSLLDQHFGTIETWRNAISEMHKRGMYVVLDNTFATLGDLIGFEGYLNVTAPFTLNEHQVQWKSNRVYHDFHFSNDYNTTCQYPKLWLETGFPVGEDVASQMKGCYGGEFDQYGDTEAFGVYPDWRRQLSKFASVQDRLREWHEPTRLKLENFYCMMIAQLDIDGYRYDKAVQSTVDAMAYANKAMRTCAKRFKKDNFFLPGEITGGNVFGSLYIGRGRQPDMRSPTLLGAVQLNHSSDGKYFLRSPENAGLDGAAFHYTVYRTLTRFLGMDGNLAAGYDSPLNWVNMWNDFLLSNDFTNPNTGVFDPRHMYGVTNQDVFRWGAIQNGTHRQMLGHFITTMVMPGIPLLLWGEEQGFYVLDNTATNYIFGRQPISPALAWKTHGCYSFSTPSTQYYEMPLEAAKHGCNDDTVSYDHRDPSHPMRNIIKHMFNLRDYFPVLNDGFFLQQLSNQTEEIQYPGSSGIATETGMWSITRGQFPGAQNLSSKGNGGSQPIWLLYSNWNMTKNYQFNCSNNDENMNTTALIAPFDAGVTVKNLFYPFDEQTLEASPRKLGIDGSTQFNGCLRNLTMGMYGYAAYVPVDSWTRTKPMITKFSPGHDARFLSNVTWDKTESIDVELQFSAEMNCESVTNSISFNSTNDIGIVPYLDENTVNCTILDTFDVPKFVGAVPGTWRWKATVRGIPHGIHRMTVNRPNSKRSPGSTNATDHFMFRTGALDNPMIFPFVANYSTTLLSKRADGALVLDHSAPGADMWRYSTNFGSSFSTWMKYEGGTAVIPKQPWSGTSKQAWQGDHVRVEYFSRLAGSSSHVQEGDANNGTRFRRFPHLFLNGPYNQYGYDAGLDNEMQHTNDSNWEYHFMTEWRSSGTLAQVNVWGMNADGQPDQSLVYGDVDGDSILDRLPPSSLAAVTLNITVPPPQPFLGWRIVVDDGTMRFRLIPSGNMYYQMIAFILLCVIPVATSGMAVWAFMMSFYQVKFNEIGVGEKAGYIPLVFRRNFSKSSTTLIPRESMAVEKPVKTERFSEFFRQTFLKSTGVLATVAEKRRTILIATMEYDIEDWAIKVKIGGLGVMAQLMGKNLGHQDLIWVVPCVGDIDYPEADHADPMTVTILGRPYEIKVSYHVLRNITYVLLDAPVFRGQTKAEPYPPRMDDMPSAIYYSAWNQCIAHAINRFPIDLYHINDYHGSIAPLYLLPKTIPACLSLHNAEFQGLWPVRNKEERDEVCDVFNLPTKVAAEYVQFGEVFNMLHAGASYLRVHQQGFGAVGVSKKYGKRAHARYPIFWGLNKIGKLPNPDPSDIGEWDKKLPKETDIRIDAVYEAGRGELRRQAQEWAGLEQNPTAELFVFVGRWSMQKGIDLIADIFPSILEAHPNVQLITIGPVIDLYGKFAAAKLDYMMKVYPGRVCSKPVFTALPPFIFSGAEFALIPSRDEPFGLVAVEFGRKGALGVGARVGGLGQMPGWWYTVESTSTSHLLHQFRIAIEEALSAKQGIRAMMRARSAKQRFPVAQWVEDLEILQGTSIRIHDKIESSKRMMAPKKLVKRRTLMALEGGPASGSNTPSRPASMEASRRSSFIGAFPSLGNRLTNIQSHFREHLNESMDHIERQLTRTSSKTSLGSRFGPGHLREGGRTIVHNREGLYLTMDENIVEEEAVDDQESASDMSDVEALEVPAQVATRGRRATPREIVVSSPSFLGAPLSPTSPTLPLSPGFPQVSFGADPLLGLALPPQIYANAPQDMLSSTSLLSVDTVVGDRIDFNLQRVDPFFTDSAGIFYGQFQRKLEGLNGSNSESATCIEEYLVKSEKKWFEAFRNAKLGRINGSRESLSTHRSSRGPTREPSRAPTTRQGREGRKEGAKTHTYDSTAATVVPSTAGHSRAPSISSQPASESGASAIDEFLLGKDYVPPTGLAKWMQIRVGDWPIYSFFMAFGQIIAANSYQITLLTGEIGQSAGKLYAIASVYLVTSVMWWALYRRYPSKVCLSFPFAFYGLAFLCIGIAHYGRSIESRGWIQNVGSGLYAVASSSGSIYFSLNFGDEGGAQVKAWVFRACVIQGTQQIYVVALWYWGSIITKNAMAGILPTDDSFANTWKITAVLVPVACIFWILSAIMWFGLPSYYNQQPGAVPDFYRSVTRRKIVLWFFVTVLIQNFFLSAPYGRNWSFLFSSYHTSTAQIMGLVVAFFVGVWGLSLYFFGWLSKSHTWILPLAAVGLGAPRWAQVWWGTSNIGLWLPWAGDLTTSALVSRCLWLWLGVLDSIQGVGLGMILLGTLTRVHVCFTLIMAQVLGSIATMVARGCAPNSIGPGPISPDISGGVDVLWQAWFWVGLGLNLMICGGYFLFYRKEQLTKP